MAEDQQYPTVADTHTHGLTLADAPAVQHQPQQQHQGRVEVQDQPLQRRADVGQTCEIQKTRQVVTGDAQPDDAQPVPTGQADCRNTVTGPAGPPGDSQKERQGEQHAQHDEGDCIHPMAVRQLDNDRFGAESNGARDSQQQAGCY
jgi:hypothetical protein